MHPVSSNFLDAHIPFKLLLLLVLYIRNIFTNQTYNSNGHNIKLIGTSILTSQILIILLLITNPNFYLRRLKISNIIPLYPFHILNVHNIITYISISQIFIILYLLINSDFFLWRLNVILSHFLTSISPNRTYNNIKFNCLFWHLKFFLMLLLIFNSDFCLGSLRLLNINTISEFYPRHQFSNYCTK